jgi:hypothetical protein
MRHPIQILAILGLSTIYGPTHSATINFDDLAGGELTLGTIVTTQYSGLGVSFQASGGFSAHAESSLGNLIPGSSPKNVLWANQGGGSATGQYLEVVFSSAVQSVSVLFGTSSYADITLDIYFENDLLNSVTLIGENVSDSIRTGKIEMSGAAITTARLYSRSDFSGNSLNFAIDDLVFEVKRTVPEPSVSALALFGLTCLFVAGRRQGKPARTKCVPLSKAQPNRDSAPGNDRGLIGQQ